MAPWAGQEITLTFSVQLPNGPAEVSGYLDEAFLGTPYYPDNWATIEGPPTVNLGDSLALTLHYGNKASAPAEGVVLTAILPAELSFVSADPVPTTRIGQVLKWDLGTLTAGAGLGTITITTKVTSTFGTRHVRPVAAVLDSDTTELNLTNNSSQITVKIDSLVFLPLVRH